VILITLIKDELKMSQDSAILGLTTTKGIIWDITLQSTYLKTWT